jgi:hypothetical protein
VWHSPTLLAPLRAQNWFSSLGYNIQTTRSSVRISVF